MLKKYFKKVTLFIEYKFPININLKAYIIFK